MFSTYGIEFSRVQLPNVVQYPWKIFNKFVYSFYNTSVHSYVIVISPQTSVALENANPNLVLISGLSADVLPLQARYTFTCSLDYGRITFDHVSLKLTRLEWCRCYGVLISDVAWIRVL